MKERVAKPLEIHFHSDFGLGVANTIMAVLSGAEVIHSTVGGIGERCGQYYGLGGETWPRNQ
ncbi:MAG: hypothetical protein ABIJ57_08990 [Pseudomonadota bacterium]